MSTAPAGKFPAADLEPDPAALAILERQSRRSRRWWWLGGGALLAAIALIAVMVGGRSTPKWETVPVTEGSLVMTVTAVGQLEPMTSVEVGSDLTGTVQTVPVDANDAVVAGQVLARLDPSPYQSSVTQHEAAVASSAAGVEQAKVNLEAAELSLGRTQRLLGHGAATPVELENAQVQVDTARAALTSARAQLSQAEATLERSQQDLEDSVITSPIDGVVIRRHVDPGQTVVSAMQATPLFEVASDLSLMRAEVGVDEADVGRVKPGQKAHFTVSAWPDKVFDATVVSIDLAPDATAAVVSYDAELRIDNSEMLLRPGMTATAEIEVGRLDDVTRVPTEALRFRPPRVEAPEGRHLWTLQGDTPTAVPIKVLGSDGTYTAFQSDTLTAGSVVVVGEATQ